MKRADAIGAAERKEGVDFLSPPALDFQAESLRFIHLGMGIKLMLVTLLFPLFSLSQEITLQHIDAVIARGDLQAAKEFLERYENMEPPSSQLYQTWGDLYGVEKNWEQALVFFKKALDLNEENAACHFKAGSAYGMMALKNRLKGLRWLDDIKYHFKRAADLDKSHLEVRWALIEFYLELPGILGGSIKAAEEYAAELSEIHPVEGMLALGYIDDYRGEQQAAKSHYLQAAGYMNKIPENYPRENIHYQLGKIASRYQLYQEWGIWHLQQYERQYNSYSTIGLEWVYYHLARIHMAKNRYEKAKVFLSKCLETAPGFKLSDREYALLKAS